MFVINKMPRHVTIGDHCTLFPGSNEVTPEAWAEAEKIAVVRHYVETEQFEVKRAESLKDLKPDAAIVVVQSTYSLDTLGGWFVDETRKNVRAAIDKQREAVRSQIAAAESETSK